MRLGQIRNNPGSQAQPAKRVNHRIADWFGTRIPVRTATRTSRHLCRRMLDGTASAAWDNPATYGSIWHDTVHRIICGVGSVRSAGSLWGGVLFRPCRVLDPLGCVSAGVQPGIRSIRPKASHGAVQHRRGERQVRALLPLLRSLGGGTRSEDAAGNPAHVRPHRARSVSHPFQQLCLCPIQGRE